MLREENQRLRAENYIIKKSPRKRQVERDQGISVGEAYELGIGVLYAAEGGAMVPGSPISKPTETDDHPSRCRYVCSK